LFLCFGQLVGVIGVFWWMIVLFCAVMVVGIVSLVVQGLPLVASAEYRPWGRVSLNVVTGWSGIVRRVLLVMPLLMNVSAFSWMVMP
jgi:hypothetical protein